MSSEMSKMLERRVKQAIERKETAMRATDFSKKWQVERLFNAVANAKYLELTPKSYAWLQEVYFGYYDDDWWYYSNWKDWVWKTIHELIEAAEAEAVKVINEEAKADRDRRLGL